MMMNLFSIFDPMSSLFDFSLNWISSILIFFFISKNFWLISSGLKIIWMKITLSIHNELKPMLNNYMYKGTTSIFYSLFMFILFNKFLGLFPYIFTSTSHLSTTLTLALPLWLSFMIYGWINKTNQMFTHLVPQNTPFILMPSMVLIESISNLIRTITLSVQLTANMIAGHLLMTLLSNLSTQLSTSMIFISIIIQLLLLTLKSSVAMIQAYVFMILSMLYSSEVN
uniref:ATP synthase subunit a n=1 Tax=Cimbex luteus TaxID=1384799 RepID=A0A7T1C5B1_9HYME|nr:ATP synthase F0 subunit 6 [Cimbex luteus]QPM99416.1 ATP synthase F0 subunit 6 [Cimbex luteus]UXW64281.1 ATP synthase F0 subunit 6 [Cimbex luteus]